MEQPAQSYFSVVGRHWILLAAITIIPTIVMVVLLYTVFPKKYEAKASVIFPLKQASSFMRKSLTELDLPVSGMSQLLSSTPTLYNHIAIIESRTLAERVHLDLLNNQGIDLQATYKGIIEDPEYETDEERYIAYLKKMMRTINVDDTDRGMAVISYEHKNPEYAAAVVNTYIEETLDFLHELNQATQSDLVSFLELRQGDVAENLQTAEEEIQQVKEDTGILSVEENARQLISTWADIEAMTAQAEIDLEGSLSMARSMASAGVNMENFYAYILAGEEPPNDAPAPAIEALGDQTIARLRSELSSLLLERQQLSLYATPENPEVIIIDTQIEAIQRELYREFTNFFDSSVADLVVESTAYQAQLDVAEEIMVDLENRLDAFPPEERHLIELERDRDVLESIYLVVTQELEQARIQELREEEPFTVLDGALTPTKPSKPRKVLTTVATFALAFWFGIFTIFAIEGANRRRQARGG